MRSVQEATIKLAFIYNCTENKQRKRLKEYLYDLQGINSLKQSEIAKRVLSNLNIDSSISLAFLPLILDDIKESELKTKWPVKKRKELERKWSYGEMMREQSLKIQGSENIVLSLAHPYKTSSHLLHADETGIGIIAERALRNETDKEKIETSHFCRLLSDSLSYLIVCGFSISFAFKKNPIPFKKILIETNPTFDKIEKLQLRVFGDKDYDKYRT